MDSWSTGLTRALAGSVADDVIREGGLAVLILRQPNHGPLAAKAPLGFNTILVLDDGSPRASSIIDSAIAIATPGSTRFIVLQVVEPFRPIPHPSLPFGYLLGPADDNSPAGLVADARAQVHRIGATIAERSRCAVDPYVIVDGHPARAIVEFAKSQEVDLIAMTTHVRGASRFVFGSVTDAVVRSTNLPMLVLRPSVE